MARGVARRRLVVAVGRALRVSAVVMAGGGMLAGIPRAARARHPPRRDAVIVVSPHPDDGMILAAGTLHELAAAGEVRLAAIYLTSGDRATVPGPCGHLSEAAKVRRIVRLRERETRAAWAVVNPGRRTRLRFLRGPDGGLVASSRLVGGVREDVFSPAGERVIRRVRRFVRRLSRRVVRLTLVTTSLYDAHGDHRAAYVAARRAGKAFRRRRGGAEVRLWSFIVHDEVVADLPICCVGDLHWPGPGLVHDYALLTDSSERPRPPHWNLTRDVSSVAAVRWGALSKHASQVFGNPDLCMPVAFPDYYVRWGEKTEEPFYEEVL